MKLIEKYLFLLQGVFLFLVIISGIPVYSQTSGTGNIQYILDDRVDQLIAKQVQINQKKAGTEGFRIQIFFDSGINSRTKAQVIYDEFLAKYPDFGVYLTFKAPNYKVRIGDFRTKLDARRFLNEIIVDYPNAWIIEDLINLPHVEPLN